MVEVYLEGSMRITTKLCYRYIVTQMTTDLRLHNSILLEMDFTWREHGQASADSDKIA